jgi:hypothetical protein
MHAAHARTQSADMHWQASSHSSAVLHADAQAAGITPTIQQNAASASGSRLQEIEEEVLAERQAAAAAAAKVAAEDHAKAAAAAAARKKPYKWVCREQ